MKSSPCSFVDEHQVHPHKIHQHKLPSKLSELFQAADNTSIVGFGATQTQQEFMLLCAILNSQNSVFFEELNQELHEYFLTLSNDLLVNSNILS